MTITLTPEAEQRLRLRMVPVERRAIPVARLFGGEVVLPLAAEGAALAPVVGGSLEDALRLADMQAAADGRVLQAQAQVDAARIALARAEKVLNAEAGSVRSVDEAKATLSVAEAVIRTAKAQRELLGAPVAGAARGQNAWVRVAIYSGEAASLDAAAPASIRSLSVTSGGAAAKPVSGPRTANAQNATVDWYYELPAGVKARAGERVAVEIPVADNNAERLVIPFGAVLHDIHGGQWVYTSTGPHTYARHRIQVARLAGELAVLATGPAPGTKVVTAGSAELFGTEFMTGK